MRIKYLLLIVAVILTFTGCRVKPTQDSVSGNSSSITAAISETAQDVSSAEEPLTADIQQASTDTSIIQIILDKTYHNERFDFEVDYPSVWSIVEEGDHPELPDQGILIFIDNANITYNDYQSTSFDISKIDYIRIFGQDSPINVGGSSFESSEFITNDGLKGTRYTKTVNGRISTYIVLSDYNETYGMSVNVSIETNNRFSDIIEKILKRVKIRRS